jgi:hypothetical protein
MLDQLVGSMFSFKLPITDNFWYISVQICSFLNNWICPIHFHFRHSHFHFCPIKNVKVKMGEVFFRPFPSVFRPTCLGRAPAQPCVQGSGPLPSAYEGSGAATCQEAPDPPCHLGGVRHCHVSLSNGPHITAKKESDTDMCPSALDRTHLSGGLRC